MSGGFSGLFLLMLLSAMPFQRLLSSLVFGSTTLPIAASAFRDSQKYATMYSWFTLTVY